MSAYFSIASKNRPSDRELAKIKEELDAREQANAKLHREWLENKRRESEYAKRKEQAAREKEAERKKQLEEAKEQKNEESVKEWRERKAVDRLRRANGERSARLNSGRSSLTSGSERNPYFMYTSTRSKQDMTCRTTLSAKSESMVQGGQNQK